MAAVSLRGGKVERVNLSNPPRGPFSLSSPGLHAVHQFLVLFVVAGEGGGEIRGLFFYLAYVARRIEFDHLSAEEKQRQAQCTNYLRFHFDSIQRFFYLKLSTETT